MQHIPVSSSNLTSVGYEPSRQILEILFHSGGLYQYSGVPTNIYHGLMSASSHGKYFHQFIKNVYPYRRIR